MTTLRPPLLRQGSRDASLVPSLIGNRLVRPDPPVLGQLAAPAPASPAPAPALVAAQPTARNPTRRAAALLECRTLIALHGITEQDLFGR